MTDTAPRFQTIVGKSFKYEKIKQQIIDQLETDFTALEKQAKKAEACRGIYEFMIKFNFEDDFQSKKPNIKMIQDEFKQYKDWLVLMSNNITN